MSSFYVVRAIPVRKGKGGPIVGWARCDPSADGTRPTDLVILRDGSAYTQAEVGRHLTADPSLLYPTREEAVRDGIERLRAAEAAGAAVRVGP